MNLIAQVVADNPLASFGLVGVVVGWLMWLVGQLRNDIKDFRVDIKDSAHRLDALSRTLLVQMLEDDSKSIQTKAYCREAIQKIDARSAKDGK